MLSSIVLVLRQTSIASRKCRSHTCQFATLHNADKSCSILVLCEDDSSEMQGKNPTNLLEFGLVGTVVPDLNSERCLLVKPTGH